MSDGFEIEYDQERGKLQLFCKPEAFVSFREHLRKELADEPDIIVDKIIDIQIIDIGAAETKPVQRKSRWLNYGCYTLACLITIIFGIGIATIFKWLGV